MPGTLASSDMDAIRKRADAPTLVAKLFNVVFYGGYAMWYFYCGLLLRWRGVPSSLIGVVLAVRPVVGTTVTPLWTALADVSGRHQALHVGSLVVGGASRLLYLAVPATATPLLAAAVASEVLTCHMTPLSDTAVVTGLKRLGRPQTEYAQQRLWGAVGAGWIFMPLAGVLLQGRSHATAWHIALALHIGLLWLSACLAPRLWGIGGRSRARADSGTEAAAAAEAAEASAPRGGHWLNAARQVRPSLRGCARCVLFFWCGCFHAATEGFLFLRPRRVKVAPCLVGPRSTSDPSEMPRHWSQAAAPKTPSLRRTSSDHPGTSTRSAPARRSTASRSSSPA